MQGGVRPTEHVARQKEGGCPLTMTHKVQQDEVAREQCVGADKRDRVENLGVTRQRHADRKQDLQPQRQVLLCVRQFRRHLPCAQCVCVCVCVCVRVRVCVCATLGPVRSCNRAGSECVRPHTTIP